MVRLMRRMTVLGTVAMLASAGLAQAQQRPATQPARPAAPAPAPAATPIAEPERTLASFGDWAVRCEVRPAAANTPATRACEMAMTVQDQRQQPLAVLALGRVNRTEPLKLLIQVPVNVQTGTPARLTLEGDGEPLVLAFRSCQPRGCFADLELRDEALVRRLRGRTPEQPGRVEWRDAAGNEAAFPVSFRGFPAAFDALGREGG